MGFSTWTASPLAQADPSGNAAFTIFLKGQRIGTEEVSVVRDQNGLTISASGTTGAPFNLSFDTFIARYAPDGTARSLELSAQLRGTSLSLKTTFEGTTATSNVVQAGQQSQLKHTVSPTTISLPNNFYASYEALALRLHTAKPGDTIPVFIAPQAELQVRVDQMTPRRMETPTNATELRQFDLTFPNPGGALRAEVWIDTRGRLARLAIPVASVAVVRDDLTTVMARLDTFSHPRDKDVFIPANGFNLAATVTPPAPPAGAAAGRDSQKAPAVILLSGSGAQDRDETVFGIPILGQIAARLSDAGYYVVRYDKRGVGQSGGRIESATLDAYAEDARAVVQWVRRQKEVDRDHVILAGHSEGGAVALLTAGRNRGDIDGIALLAAPGTTGREITLAQQKYQLDRTPTESEASKQQKVELQTRLMDAVVTGQGWETIPPELRRQAESPWFKSWLTYDPAEAMDRTRQPVFIIQGNLDVQIPPMHADRLETLANDRSRTEPPTRKVIVPGVNHLLVPAQTGDLTEYDKLTDKNVSKAITDALIAWLNDVTRR